MITLFDAKNAYYRQTFYHQFLRNSDGSPLRARVNGQCKLWKRDLNRFELPIKHGLKDCGYITDTNATDWCLSEEDALLHPIKKDGDWHKFIVNAGIRPKSFYCSVCKKVYPIASHGGMGYAITKKDDLLCYECCASEDTNEMMQTGKAMLYLSAKQHQENTHYIPKHDYYVISNWPGSLKFKSYHFKEGKHNMAKTRTDVWFYGPGDFVWHGVCYGNNTQICHCKRTKQRTF